MGQLPSTWASVGRVLLKTALLFVLFNVLFAWWQPLDALGRLTLYNTVLPGRRRLPYGEAADAPYNLSLNNLPAMLGSHAISRPKAADEFRVLLLGDSAVWGWLLDNEETLAGQINAAGLRTADGRRVVAYNLGYPILSLSKDLLLLDAAMPYEPDLIVWLITLDSLYRPKQLASPLLQNNPAHLRQLITNYQLPINLSDTRLIEPGFFGRTLVGQRRALADLLRLQLYGFAWAATGVDQVFPAEFTPRQSDFEADVSWQEFDQPTTLTEQALALDVLAAGIQIAGDTPLLIVNEPIFVSDGRHSHLRYNAFYPRWAYDSYRQWLAEQTAAHDWPYLDLWDVVPPTEFTDTPVHLTAAGVKQLAERVGAAIIPLALPGRGAGGEGSSPYNSGSMPRVRN